MLVCRCGEDEDRLINRDDGIYCPSCKMWYYDREALEKGDGLNELQAANDFLVRRWCKNVTERCKKPIKGFIHDPTPLTAKDLEMPSKE